jgi:hypothetical protein
MDDPFEINKVKVPKISTGLTRGQKAGRKFKQAASNTFHNATSKPAYNPSHQTKFGRKTPRQPKEDTARDISFGAGVIGGSIAGTAAGYTAHGGQNREDVKQIRQYRRAQRKDRVGKAFRPKRPHLITEMGNSSRKTKIGDRPNLKTGYLVAGTALGAAGGYGGMSAGKHDARQYLNREYRKGKKKAAVSKAQLERYTPNRKERAKMRAKNAAAGGAGGAAGVLAIRTANKAAENHLTEQKLYRGLKPSARSLKVAGAAGLAVGAMSAAGKYDKHQYRVKKNRSEIVAKQEKASGGRLAAGGVFPGYHGAFAGKKGHKLRAVGNEVAGNIVGGTAGGLAASIATRGKSMGAARIGTSAGGVAGGVVGTARAQRKGHFKVQKNDSVSAFGVDHGF